MVLLPDGSIRLYGAENGISTAVSKDGGRTWITDGFRLIESVGANPDVHLRPDGTFVIYYSATVSDKGAKEARKGAIEKKLERTYIRMAESKDGLNWKLVEGDIIAPSKKKAAVFDPDYVLLNDGTEIIYFNESRTAKDRKEGNADLRMAVKNRE